MVQSTFNSVLGLVLLLLVVGFVIMERRRHHHPGGGVSRWLDTHHINWMSQKPDKDHQDNTRS